MFFASIGPPWMTSALRMVMYQLARFSCAVLLYEKRNEGATNSRHERVTSNDFLEEVQPKDLQLRTVNFSRILKK